MVLPAYSPELAPAERLWRLVDAPVVNRSFATLDELEAVLVPRCQALAQQRNDARSSRSPTTAGGPVNAGQRFPRNHPEVV